MTERITGREPLDPGLACLALIARYHRLPVEPEELRHRFGRRGSTREAATLVRAARHLGLRARAVRCEWPRLERLVLPAIARTRDGGYFVVAKTAGERALVDEPGAGGPRVLERAELERRWSGELVLVARRDAGLRACRRFGFSWFLPSIVRYRGPLSEVVAASFALQLLALATPLFFQVIIDKVLVHRGLTTLDVLAVGLLAVSVFEIGLGGLRTYVFAHTASRIDVTLGAELFKHLLALPVGYFESRRTGDTVARVRELETIRAFVTGSALTASLDALFTGVFFVALWQYSAALTAVVLAAVPGYVLLSLAVTPILRRRLEERFNRGAESQALLVETVHGMATVKASALEPECARRWEEQLAAYVRASFRASHWSNLAAQSASLINKVTTVLILWLGARMVMAGELSVGQLVAFNMIAARVSAPVLRLAQLWQDLQQARISVARLGDVLDAEPEWRPGRPRASLPALRGQVSFARVSFRYRPEGPPVLEDVCLEAGPGEAVGIVGASGSGKSTLAKLLLRLHLPQGGRVLIDGVDTALVDPMWLRRAVGVVPQECFLFNRSVRENIALADPGLPIETVIRAARLAGAHQFILELPEGYDTLVGEHGCTLSGGQRQRIALARALVTDPRILVLDEATSALDYESEHAIYANMPCIRAGRTLFIIAHRLSAVRLADRIIVLDGGRVVEAGRHEELVRRPGRYARLHALQADGGVRAKGLRA